MLLTWLAVVVVSVALLVVRIVLDVLVRFLGGPGERIPHSRLEALSIPLVSLALQP